MVCVHFKQEGDAYFALMVCVHTHTHKRKRKTDVMRRVCTADESTALSHNSFIFV